MVEANSGKAPDRLRDREAFNFDLFQHNPVPTVIVDMQGCVLKSNLARREQGLPLPSLGSPIFDPEGPGDEPYLYQELHACIEQRKVRDVHESRIGEAVLRVRMAPFQDGVLVLTEDITAEKAAEEQARIHQQQLIQADKMVALGTLVAGVAHEVSNPNNAMLLSATSLELAWADLQAYLDQHVDQHGELMLGGRPYKDARDDLTKLIGVMTRSAKRIRDLLSELKNFARQDTSEPRNDIDVSELAQSSSSLMHSLIKESATSFVETLAEDLPPVTANPQKLEQVIINLISNACQALKNSPGKLSLKTWHAPKTKSVTIEVCDEGCGIAPEDIARIKDPFFTTKHDDGGTGLGLAISDKIVQSYGGSLELTSQPGAGTVARVLLPCFDGSRKQENDREPDTGS